MYDLNQLRDSVDLRTFYPLDLIRGRWQPGDNRWTPALCIFHADSRPSMSLSRLGYICHAASCGRHGDIFRFVMETQGVDFREAIARLGNAQIQPLPRTLRQVPPPPTPQYTFDDVARFVAAMRDQDYAELQARTCITAATAQAYSVGLLSTGNGYAPLYTIPILDPSGKLVNIRVYNPTRGYRRPKYYPLRPGAGSTVTGLHDIYDYDEIFLAAGEKDWLLMRQWGLPACTGTVGETFRREWLPWFESFRRVWVVYDADEGGYRGTQLACRLLGRAAMPFNWHLARENPPQGYDFGDYVREGHTPDDFERALRLCAHAYGG